MSTAWKSELEAKKASWLVTGAAGFIGSHLVERLLTSGQSVVGFDNFATGHQDNLDDVREKVGSKWENFRFVKGDIRSRDELVRAFDALGRPIDIVVHQAALGSVSRSMDDPIASHANNVSGFLEVLWEARRRGIRRFVYASSSSVYGDHPALPKVESEIGNALSPYAATKVADEIYAGVFHRAYGMETVGLRYFNVFGSRQDPNGAYAAVIPRWFSAMIRGKPVEVYGDGETSRDFCYIENVVNANLLAATTRNPKAFGAAFNVAAGEKTSLTELHGMIRDSLVEKFPKLAGEKPVYKDFRAGDIRHSLADLTRVREILGYAPLHTIRDGMKLAREWYLKKS